jgi:SseB protein C-terminal domain
MSNKIINGVLPAGARIRIGVPNESPDAALSALKTHFASRPLVLSTRLGLMEVLNDENPEGFFTYAIGINVSAPEHIDTEITAAINTIMDIPTGRWPISFFPSTEAYFTAESIVFYKAKTSSSKRGFFAKLFGKSR